MRLLWETDWKETDSIGYSGNHKQGLRFHEQLKLDSQLFF
jgi:hypothetical protein